MKPTSNERYGTAKHVAKVPLAAWPATKYSDVHKMNTAVTLFGVRKRNCQAHTPWYRFAVLCNLLLAHHIVRAVRCEFLPRRLSSTNSDPVSGARDRKSAASHRVTRAGLAGDLGIEVGVLAKIGELGGPEETRGDPSEAPSGDGGRSLDRRATIGQDKTPDVANVHAEAQEDATLGTRVSDNAL